MTPSLVQAFLISPDASGVAASDGTTSDAGAFAGLLAGLLALPLPVPAARPSFSEPGRAAEAEPAALPAGGGTGTAATPTTAALAAPGPATDFARAATAPAAPQPGAHATASPQPTPTAPQPSGTRPDAAGPIPTIGDLRGIAAPAPVATPAGAAASPGPARAGPPPQVLILPAIADGELAAATPAVQGMSEISRKPSARPAAALEPRLATPPSAPVEPGRAAADETVIETAAPGDVADVAEVAPSRAERSAGKPPPAAQRSLPSPPVLQVGMQIAQAASRRVERLVVQLEPAALGRVEVRLDFSHDNRVSALIAADRPETLEILQRDSRALERGLQDAGLRLGSDGLSFSLRQDQRQHERGARSQHATPRGGPFAAVREAGHVDAARRTRWLGAERVLDIRI